VNQLSHTWLGTLSHAAATAEMEQRRERLLAGDASAAALLLCEHTPVITLGRSACEADVVASPSALEDAGVELVRTSRGGEVTYHGPGQLMIYPVVRLNLGLVSLLAGLGEAIGRIAAALGVPGARFRRECPGVWVEGFKIAACGVHVRRRVMIHGFALNLDCPPSVWQLIVPCGQVSRPAASVASLGGESTPPADIAARFGDELARAVAKATAFGLR